ncbi:hypothetical protein CUC15_05765 [Oceanobacillus zhaokaii]|uniref:VWFA domain-containing protein n=1 Tax=Oceanobacillus zhaokaii TaxID=2052660 RepID=A0A345PEM4_9BACI|nr:VWA domain-containing protein [Oceanobacillus zhaokaii]AXI08454.1 hypothetical protein CUC15_05765 [Oceanobacillus zhaokaii]
MVKMRLVLGLVFLLFILFACDENASENSTGAEDSHENEQEETEPVTVEAEAEDTEEKEEESQKETKEEVIDEDTVENLPPIPTSFAEAVDYPLTGQLAGVEFINQPEIIEVLDSFPTLTSESTEEEVEHWERYLWTLFKEDFSPVNVPIDQWESMQFSDPTAVDNEGIAVLERKETYNIAILLDSSGSMGNYEGERTRMDLAKEAIQQFVENLPEEATISLDVYGHIGTGSNADKEKSCSNIEEVYPLSTYNSDKFSKALNQFEPAGWTPMAKAIEVVEGKLKDYNGEENTNIIYIVSDGVETCEGDPVKTIQSLAESQIDPVINIIGYQVDNEGLEQLKEMAEASDGRYINAANQADLVSEFEQTVDMAKVWAEWSNDARETIAKLSNTIRDQVLDWNSMQKELADRENGNLNAAIKYLNEEQIIDSSVHQEFKGQIFNSHISIKGDIANIYLDIAGTNANEFLDNYFGIIDRYRDNID